MVDPLRSVRLKLQRAEMHRQTFERELIEFFSHEPERAVAHVDQEGKRVVLDLTEPLPELWGCVIGDCVQNLRQALDHWIWAAALAHKRKPPRLISFTITRDEAAWDDYLTTRHARDTKKAIGSAAWAVVTKMQPYNSGRPDPNPDTDPLWVINELARKDRHQTLHLAIARQEGTFIGFGAPPRRGNVVLPPHDQGPYGRFVTPPLINDPGLSRIRIGDAAGVVTGHDTYQQAPFEIVFDPDGTYLPDTRISHTLNALLGRVNDHSLPLMASVFN